MEKAFVIIKEKYNHMNFNNLDSWFQTSFGFHSFNLSMGMITMQQFQLVCGAIGLLMQLIQFLTKQYWLIKNNKNPDAETSTTDIDAAPFERRCLNCAKAFAPVEPNQVFCDGECKDDYLVALKNRTPFPNANAPQQ